MYWFTNKSWISKFRFILLHDDPLLINCHQNNGLLSGLSKVSTEVTGLHQSNKVMDGTQNQYYKLVLDKFALNHHLIPLPSLDVFFFLIHESILYLFRNSSSLFSTSTFILCSLFLSTSFNNLLISPHHFPTELK